MTEPTPPSVVSPSRRELLVQLAWAATFGVAAMLITGRGYMHGVPPGTSATGWCFTLLAGVAQAATFALLAWLLAAPLLAAWPRRWLGHLLVGIGGGFGLLLLAGDVVVFGLFRMHYNSMVWAAFTTPGAGDSIQLGLGTILSITFTVVLTAALLGGTLWLTRRPWFATPAAYRGAWIVLGTAAALILTEKGWFAVASLRQNREIARVAQLYPLYQPLTIRRWAVKQGWATATPEVRLDAGSGTLAYPLAAVSAPPDGARPNILVIAIEGARADQLHAEVMPNLRTFADSSLDLRRHYSGGNATRFGLFSLFYGLHSTYWNAMLAERHGAVLFDVLRARDYRMRVDSCTDLSFPEFRQTCFAAIPEALNDTFPTDLPRVDRDRLATDRADAFISEAIAAQVPFFSFVFYDASHSLYRFPPEHARFAPFAAEQDIDYLKIAAQHDAVTLRPLYNRYRNSLHYVDAQIGRLLTRLRDSGQLEHTIVIVVGDHGEEFGELGTYGHNGTFNRFQVQTLGVVHLPGVPAATVERLTSHIDVVPSILRQLGVTAPLATYTQGLPLDEPAPDRDHLVCVSWDNLALIDAEATLIVGTQGYRSELDLRDQDYRPLDNPDAFAVRQGRLLSLIQSLRAFMQ